MSLSINKEMNSSTSSFGPNAKICRICHIVERPGHATCSVKGKSPEDSFTKRLASFSRIILGANVRREGSFDEEEMIAPCQCKGTMRYVHRGCLNQWRMASGRSDSFQRCEQCFALYQFKEGILSRVMNNRLCVFIVTGLIFWSWILTSMLITTTTDAIMFNLLPKIDEHQQHFPLQMVRLFLGSGILQAFPRIENVLNSISNLIHAYNLLMDNASRLFYGLVFIAITEFIFLTPSFLLSFNILFCVWRIQKYELFFDKWLLAGLTLFGVYQAWKSIETTISNLANRTVKLWLLEVEDQDKYEKQD